MRLKASKFARSALLGLGIAGGLLAGAGGAFAQADSNGEYGDPPDLQMPNYSLPPEKRVYPPFGAPAPAPIPAPVPAAPGWHGGWHDRPWNYHRPWYGPSVGVYVEPAPRYYRPRTYSRRVSDPHVEWCYDRYRSYREWDNSWQPNRGPRRECISPYY